MSHLRPILPYIVPYIAHNQKQLWEQPFLIYGFECQMFGIGVGGPNSIKFLLACLLVPNMLVCAQILCSLVWCHVMWSESSVGL